MWGVGCGRGSGGGDGVKGEREHIQDAWMMKVWKERRLGACSWSAESALLIPIPELHGRLWMRQHECKGSSESLHPLDQAKALFMEALHAAITWFPAYTCLNTNQLASLWFHCCAGQIQVDPSPCSISISAPTLEWRFPCVRPWPPSSSITSAPCPCICPKPCPCA